MRSLNLGRNRKRIKYVGREPRKAGFSTGSNRSNNKLLKRRVTGSIRTFIWRFFSSFKFSFVIIIAFISLVGFGIYWILKNQYFLIKNFEITGQSLVEENKILNSISESSGKWIFFITPSSLERKISETSNFIKSAYVEKKLPDTLVVHVEERNPIAVWRTVNGAYLIDGDGFVLERSLSDGITLEKVLSDIYVAPEVIDTGSSSENASTVSDESMDGYDDNSDENVQEDTEKIKLEEIMDSELISQIEMDKKSRGNEQSLLDLNFDLYNNLPDSFKKYPQVKALSDSVFGVNSTIDWNIWGGYSRLLSLLKQRNGFTPKEIIIFSETKVLVLMENDKQAYFRLDQDLAGQVRLLEFVYGRLMIDSIDFKEIDLRFKRPVIRN